ncbi:MAG: TRAP transporter large permease subunit [Hyphomicrobiaceae bacterium]|nr:TRAP transporter large permease subunit [Hyphomicrobiaceae bacterium]
MITAALMGLSIVVLLIIGWPISIALGIPGLVWLWLLDPIRLVYLKGAQNAIWNTAENYSLLSVPMFVLMGELLQRTDISRRFYNAVASCLWRLPGGALHSNIVACAVLAAVSGSSVATAAMIGAAAIPSLIRLKYDRKLIFGTLAAGGTLGILIPPSIPLIIYAAMTEQSVGRLFMASLVPGLMMTGIFFLYVLWRGWRLNRAGFPNPRPDVQPTGREIAGDMLPFGLIFAVVFGGLYLGWATPTEIAGIGVLVSLVTALLYRQLSWYKLWDALISSVTITSVIIFVVIGAQIFSYALFSYGVTRSLAEWTANLPVPPVVTLSVIVVMYLILGMFIDSISMMVLTLGVVYPVIVKLGYDPIWFAVVLVILIEIGLITPPVGLNLFTINAIVPGLTSVTEVAQGSLPFVLLLLLGVMLLIIFPEIALWLPSKMF